jgi:hypothetical protein
MTQSDNPSNDAVPAVVPDVTSSFSLEQYYREKLANVRQHLPEAARQFKEAGVERVHIHYDGCGDSGQIESIEYTDREGKPVDPVGKVTITEEQLTDLFYDLMQVRHSGWQDGDGGFGEFEWDLLDDSLDHTHNERFTDYDTTEHEGL